MEFLSPGAAALVASSQDRTLEQFVNWLDQTQTPFYQALEAAAIDMGRNDPDFKGLGYTHGVFTGSGMCIVSTTHLLFAAKLKFPEQIEARATRTLVSNAWHYLSELEIGPNLLLLDGALGQYNSSFLKKYLLCLAAEAGNYYPSTARHDAKWNLSAENRGVESLYKRHLTKSRSLDRTEQAQIKILQNLGVIERVSWKARLARGLGLQRLLLPARSA